MFLSCCRGARVFAFRDVVIQYVGGRMPPSNEELLFLPKYMDRLGVRHGVVIVMNKCPSQGGKNAQRYSEVV